MNNNYNKPVQAPQTVSVRFEFSHPTATAISIAGTFSNWKPITKPLDPAGGGRWWADMALAPGTYEYCLIVNDQWIPDPRVRESVPNPFGGRNSILIVNIPPQEGYPVNIDGLREKEQ